MDRNKNNIINLNPVFVNQLDKKITIFSSFILIIILIFIIGIIILFLYFFFQTEFKYLFYYIFYNNEYDENEKKIYNNFIKSIERNIKTRKICHLEKGLYYPRFGLQPIVQERKLMKTLNNEIISFKNEDQCINFIN